MPFHVEIHQGLHRAKAFNLDEVELARLLAPWWRDGDVVLGDRPYELRKSTIIILEGPHLEPPDLAYGQGWNNALPVSREVTEELLARLRAGAEDAAATPVAPTGPGTTATAVAILAATADGRRAAVQALARLGLQAVDWAVLRAQLLAAASPGSLGPGVAAAGAALLVLDEPGGPSPGWLFDAGLALGALGGRAVLVRLAGEPAAAPLDGLEVVGLDGDELAARLRP
ncbi:MAG TPA: hypothetical protein VMT10_06635 [Solirubrobacteraceae bacterium]|nr:hypothetical protein [Solirubrobacteraceae bacterium]